ncbi:MAG: hypothetical protein HUK40_22245 [Desulfobacter sp.]|nr:hypothetical protein [Desulfobacter sp.]WDP86343.1 MAG: hypothetical protein HUN05_15425 [Desulfobacter sp.]
MDPMASKQEQWINEKKNPISARWQAGLEAVMDLFIPQLEKGRLTPVCPLDEKEMDLFNQALAIIDLSPGLWAAFLPPSVANAIFAPDTVETLLRINKQNPSYKIIIQRPGKDDRILCAEISKDAHRPGIDIFQSGAFLGNFDYKTHEICMQELAKAIRVHAWQKEAWQKEDYMAYAVNWFEKMAFLKNKEVVVDKNHCFFHKPTLIKTDRIDALFSLLTQEIHLRLEKNPRDKDQESQKQERSSLEPLAQTYLLDLLNLVKDLELMDFADFTDAENQKFKTEFTRSVRKISYDLENAQATGG